MRRVICFILVLAMCLSMATTVFATSAANSPTNNAPTSSNPRTGDMIMRWAFIMVLALLALCVMFVLYRKMFSK